MKFRLLVGTVAVSTLLLAPSTFSQQPPDPSAKAPTDSTVKDDKDKPPADASAKDKDKDKEILPPVIQQPDDSSVKHDGGKSDVNAIGNRKVGGRGLGDGVRRRHRHPGADHPFRARLAVPGGAGAAAVRGAGAARRAGRAAAVPG